MTTIRAILDEAKEQEHVTVQQLAALVNVCPETIWRAVRAGRVPSLLVGRRIRINRKKGIAAFERKVSRDDSRQQETTRADTIA